MKLEWRFLWVMAGWGLFVFEIPTMADNAERWGQIFRHVHLHAIQIAEEIATRLPQAPTGLTDGFWGSFFTIMAFPPHAVFLVLLFLLFVVFGTLVRACSRSAFENEESIENLFLALAIFWLGFAFLGPKLVLHGTYPELGKFVLSEPVQMTIGRTGEPTIALYLTYVYSVSALLVANFCAVLFVMGWRQYRNDRPANQKKS